MPIFFLLIALVFIFLSFEGFRDLFNKKNKYKHLNLAAIFLSLGGAFLMLLYALQPLVLYYAK